ncbi:MAG: hypothetical protein M0R74_01195 [Dehalococcoidia bacterium]|nr:hypothetical protein [Dehalococcoidia bacterium]
MIPLTATLEEYAKRPQRTPALRAFAIAQRGNLALLQWSRLYSGTEPDSPHAATIAPDGSLLRARNASGTLAVSRVTNPGSGSTFSTWTTLTTGLLNGSGLALATKPGEILLAYTTGTALLVRTSTNNGASWSAPLTLTTEATNIGSIAAAFGAAGNPCIFYTLGTSTTLKRIRRTGTTWAASGTNWTRAASVASLTGLAATYLAADFQLVITGTEATTGHKRAWGAFMGDGGFPANSWSTLTPIAEADVSSTTAFAAPALAPLDGTLRATILRKETGPVAHNRAMETATPGFNVGALGAWTEPAPHEAQSAYGLAITLAQAHAWATTPNGVWRASLPVPHDLTAPLLSARYRIDPSGARCTVELDNASASLTPGALTVGGTLSLLPGYPSGPGGAEEFGLGPTFIITRVTYRTAQGRRVATVDALGARDLLDHWHAPQSWQTAPNTLTRLQLATRIAARAGFELTASNTGPEWNERPSFALQLGESAESALARLSAVTADGIVSAERPGLHLRGFAPSDPPTFAYGPGAHPIAELTLADQPPRANWLRLQGADRYAESTDYASVYQHGPRLRPLRSLDATTDAKATASAAAARRRDAWSEPQGELVAPFHPATELFDVVDVEGAPYRVLSHGLDYRRGPQGARYDLTLGLGAM